MHKRKRGISLCKNLKQFQNENKNPQRHSLDNGIIKTKQLFTMTQQQKEKHLCKLKMQMQELDQEIKLLSKNQTHINYLENRSNVLSNNREKYNMSLRQSNASIQRYPVTERPYTSFQRNQLNSINRNYINYGPTIHPFNMYNQAFQAPPYANVTPLRQISQNNYSSYYPSTARSSKLHYPRPIPPLTPQILQVFKKNNITPVNTNIYSNSNNTKNKYSTINTNKTVNKSPQIQRNIKNEISNKSYKNPSNNKYSYDNYLGKNSPQINKKDQPKYNNSHYNKSNNKSPSKYEKNKSPEKKRQFDIKQSSPSFSKEKSPSKYQYKPYEYQYKGRYDPKYQNKSSPKLQNKNAKINGDKYEIKRGTNYYDTSYRYQQYPLKSGDQLKKQIQKEVKKQISPAVNKYASPSKNTQKFSFQNNYPKYQKQKALTNINNIINQKNTSINQSPIYSLNKVQQSPNINKTNKKQQQNKQKPSNRNEKKNEPNKNKSMDRKVTKNQPAKR